MQSAELYHALVRSLTIPVSDDEKHTMIRWLLEDRLGLSGAALLAGTTVSATAHQFDRDIQRLNAEEPIQYVLGHTWFFGRKFQVTPSVLIPRPETEGLVRLILDRRPDSRVLRVLDIGTGSGCLAVTLALECNGGDVIATDVSTDALKIADANAAELRAAVRFFTHDILREELTFENLDVVVSNPPYVRQSESVTMARNVTAYEPARALFVPDEAPLIFYRAIARKAIRALRPGGFLAVEINERLGSETRDAIHEGGFMKVELHVDDSGKDRFIVAQAPW